MEIKITYPLVKRRSRFWKVFCFIYNILFVTCIFVLPLINYLCKGKAWSIIALFSIFAVWRIFIRPGQFEINMTNHTIRSIVYIMILLILIEILISGGWGIFVIPIVCFGGIGLTAILFLSDIEGQKHNSISFIFFLLICFAAGLVGIFLDIVEIKWVYIVLSGVSLAALIILIFVLKTTIIKDFKKKINVK